MLVNNTLGNRIYLCWNCLFNAFSDALATVLKAADAPSFCQNVSNFRGVCNASAALEASRRRVSGTVSPRMHLPLRCGS
jgi:hypothetical protein